MAASGFSVSLREIVDALERRGAQLDSELAIGMIAAAARDVDARRAETGVRDDLQLCPHTLLVSSEGRVSVAALAVELYLPENWREQRFSYVAPELARAAPADPRTDVFALGVVLFELVAKQQLFAGMTGTDRLLGVLSHEREALEPRLAELPAELAAVLGRCLDPDPAERHAAPSELGAALDALLPGRSTQGTAARPHDWPTSALAVLVDELFDDRRAELEARERDRAAREAELPKRKRRPHVSRGPRLGLIFVCLAGAVACAAVLARLFG